MQLIGTYYGSNISGANTSNGENIYTNVELGNSNINTIPGDISATYYVTVGARIFLVDNTMQYTPESYTEGYDVYIDGDMNNSYFTGKISKAGTLRCNWSRGVTTTIIALSGASFNYSLTINAGEGHFADGTVTKTYSGTSTVSPVTVAVEIPVIDDDSRVFKEWGNSEREIVSVYADNPAKTVNATYGPAIWFDVRYVINTVTGETIHDRVKSVDKVRHPALANAQRENCSFQGWSTTPMGDPSESWDINSETVYLDTARFTLDSETGEYYITLYGVWNTTITVIKEKSGGVVIDTYPETHRVIGDSIDFTVPEFLDRTTRTVSDGNKSVDIIIEQSAWFNSDYGVLLAGEIINLTPGETVTLLAVEDSESIVRINYNYANGTSFDYQLVPARITTDNSSAQFTIDCQKSLVNAGYLFTAWSLERSTETQIPLLRRGVNTIELSTSKGVMSEIEGVKCCTFNVFAKYIEYDLEHTPLCKITVFNNSGGETDLTWKQSTAPIVKKAENQAGSATFSVICKDDNPLKSDYSAWSDGYVGPIDCGMRILIGCITSYGGNYKRVFYGLITTIRLDGDTISFECADYNAYLDKLGTTMRRNFRGTEVINYFDAKGDEYDDEGNVIPYAVLDDSGSDGALITPITYGWTNSKESRQKLNSVGTLTKLNSNGTRPMVVFVPVNYSSGLDTWFWGAYGGGVTVKATLRDEFGHTYQGTGYSSQRGDRSPNGHIFHSRHYDWWQGTHGWEGTVGVPVQFDNVNDSDQFHISIDSVVADHHDGWYDQPNASYTNEYDAIIEWGTTDMFIDGEWKTITQSVTTTNPDTGETRTIQTNFYKFYPSDREKYTQDGKLFCVYTKGDLPLNDVFKNIADNIGGSIVISDNLPSSVGSVAVYRVGGGNAGDYLRKACDFSDSEGDFKGIRRTFFANGTNIRIGRRYEVSDPAQFWFYTPSENSDDNEPEGITEKFACSSMNLSNTLKHRADRVTLIATVSDSSDNDEKVPVTITYHTEGAGRLRTIEALADGDGSSWYDAVQSCYNNLTTNELDRMEGTVSIPMSVKARNNIENFMAWEGEYAGSGAPIMVYDEARGIENVPMRIREITFDFNSMLITFQLNNYSMVYSSDVADSIAQAVKKSSNNGVVESNLWSRQYVYIDDDAGTYGNCTLTPNSQMWISRKIGSTYRSDRVYADKTQWFRLPTENGREFVVIGKFKADSSNELVYGDGGERTKYGVNSIGIDENDGTNHVKALAEWQRPDFQNGQTLFVCWQMKNVPNA